MALTAEKLKLKKGMRVLDVGCGFGGLSRYLASEHGVSIVAITNSREMAAYSKKNCAGLDVTVLEVDWRDLDEIGRFDRVVGIEVMFRVGRHNLDEFFAKISSCLKPDGICVIQDFWNHPDMPHNLATATKYFFPGHYVFSIDKILRQSGKYFRLEGYLDMSDDLKATGYHWLANF
ncbi:cyclopropane-fatty-acyl-phospholipid synthase [Folsomia candida]|nr:cyclopropane-fatty-acyl-phospholipid synthase [Folsomia candida]